MSRTTSTAVASDLISRDALHIHALRAGLGLSLVASLLAFAVRAEAQQTANTQPIQVRPLVGALVATGDLKDVLKNAVLVGGQASYTVNENLGVVGSFGWSPNEDKTSVHQSKLDLYQYDLGIEGRLSDLTSGSAVVTRPYVTIGGGARTYDFRNVANSSAQTNPLGYGAIGLDLAQSSGRIGLRVEARDNVTAFKGLNGELKDRKARNDLQFAAGVTFGF